MSGGIGVLLCVRKRRVTVSMAKTAIRIYLKSAIESGFSFIKRRFNNLDELNDNFRAQRDWIFEKMEKKADYKRRLAKVLEVLKMHSCKHIGISFLTENRLCEAYKAQHGESISKRSVSTYIRQLRELGFVTTLAAKREDGKQTSNIVIIEKIGTMGEKGRENESSLEARGERMNASMLSGDDEKKREVEVRSGKVAYKDGENLHTKKTSSPSKTTVKELKERKANVNRLLNFVPRWFQDRIGCCSRDAREVFEYWKVSKHLVKKTFGSLVEADEWREIVRKSVREFYLSAKDASQGKFKIHNPIGFFHSILEAEAYAHVRRCAQDSSGVFYNWLED